MSSDLRPAVIPLPPDLWDVTHLKALLRLYQFPSRLLEQDPWRSWIKQHGGLPAVLQYLKTCDLLPHQRRLLDILLATPNAYARFYARQLNVSGATYFRYLRDLAPALCRHLNAWQQDAPRPPLPHPHLPAVFTSLVGRERAVQMLQTLLSRPEVRLLTLTGPGGIGKTRLALEAAAQLLEAGDQEKLAQFPDGVFFVALASAVDPASAAERIAQATGITRQGQQPVSELLKHYWSERRLLLVLDNFEHLLEATPLLVEWLTASPGLHVLVTSRTVLKVYGEHVFTVPPLDRPSFQGSAPVEALAQCSAVKLFVERAQAVTSDFALTAENAAAVAEICTRLDGLPLAIELAAARVNLFSPQEMLPYLERRLAFLKNEAPYLPERSLRGAIDWSYELLDEAEKRIFCRLAVFANGWTAAAGQAVCGGSSDVLDRLEALLNKSLLRRQRSAGGEAQFEMLETIREYALERLLASGDVETRQRHAAYYLALAEDAEPELSGREQKQWLERLECAHDNIRAVLEWMLDAHEETMALRLTSAVWKFWHIRGYNVEGRRWIERTLAQSDHVRNAARVKTLYGGGWLYLEDTMRSAELFAECLTLARELGDPRLIALALQGRGEVLQRDKAWAEARALFEESLALLRKLGDDEETAWVLDHLGRLAWEQENYGRAEELFQESLGLFRKVGHLWGIAHSFERLGAVKMGTGNYERATAFLHESLLRFRELGDKWQIELVLDQAGLAAVKQGDFERAHNLLVESLRLNSDMDHPYGITRSLILLAALASAQGDGAHAACLCGAAQALRDLKGKALVHLDQPMHEKTLAEIHSQLDEAAFTAAWSEGYTMSLENALVYAAQPRAATRRVVPAGS